ncbi:MAG: hypothetical protein ABIK56_01385 [candidate division WOR-3 bacterium]
MAKIERKIDQRVNINNSNPPDDFSFPFRINNKEVKIRGKIITNLIKKFLLFKLTILVLII